LCSTAVNQGELLGAVDLEVVGVEVGLDGGVGGSLGCLGSALPLLQATRERIKKQPRARGRILIAFDAGEAVELRSTGRANAPAPTWTSLVPALTFVS
jgi:hypothetical protein